ncbi:NADH-dependent [FeFe] hydrogenase, group A6 [uncultured Parvimonas sp.]|uniref:NADH-dependent [FeFe] hydrogenase, group A6 n=1 Tax=uncultured Parvimonas sp. TaxID=747372 RepID=UPI00259AA9E2|nr:NADH-dependent [FeFe] hydrogenase, group A6 [uncultured Parvimonas sp.]
MVNVKINGIDVQVEKGSTILEAAKKINIKIPTLCHLDMHGLGFINRDANCRVCLVEDNRNHKLIPACDTLVKEGMDIRTDTAKVLRARKVNIELLLSNHPADCLVCSKSGNCELQDLAWLANVRKIRYSGERSHYPLDNLSHSLIRDPNKCVLCKRCETMCNEVQTVGTLTDIGRGFPTVIGTEFNESMVNTNCTFCGQCLSVCPTGALYEVSYIDEVQKALDDPEKVVLVQTAPAVRVALGEDFGMKPGSVVTGQMVTALRNIGFDYVFDTDFAADLTTMEETKEFVTRFQSGENLPILTSCCPSWVNFIEYNFPDMLNIPSTCKSPHEMFGAVAKSYFAEKHNIDPSKIVVVSIMPCIAKKYEAARPELSNEGHSDVDYVLSTRELAYMIKDRSMDFPNLPVSEFDNPLGESSGAGVIFGSTGGVMEAALRTAYNIITGEDLQELEYHELKGLKGFKEAELEIAGRKVRAAVVSGLGNARKLLNLIKSKERNYDIIEIMACPGGCIDGGGQPFIHGDTSIIEKRMNAIHTEDRNKPIRRSYQNPSIVKIYSEYLGEPGGEKAHHLLHTTYGKKAVMAD